MAAALCDWVENSIHLYLLRNVLDKAQAQAADFSGPLVFAASVFASVKIGLLALPIAAGAAIKSGAQLWSGDVSAHAWKGYAIAILMTAVR